MDDLSRRRRERQRAAATLAPQNPVFLVTRGSGEDYEVVGAFSSYALADEFRDRWRAGLRDLGDLGADIAVEVFSVDRLSDCGGSFSVTVGARDGAVVASSYNPIGYPERPADTHDAVELDGVPQHFTGYGATFEAAREAAISLRERTIAEEKER